MTIERETKGGHRAEELVRFHDGELEPAERAEFERHLAGCDDCQATLRAAGASLGAFDDLVASPAPPLDVAEAIAAMDRGATKARAERRRRRLAVGIAAIGLTAAAGIALYVATRQHPPVAPDHYYAPRPTRR